MQAEGEDKKKYSWSVKDGKMNCCESETSTCNLSKLWEVATVTAFHDAELEQATKEINAIIENIRGTNRDSSRDLHFVQIEDRHLLAWAHSDLVGPLNRDQTIRKMLRLKIENTGGSPTRQASARQTRKGGAA